MTTTTLSYKPESLITAVEFPMGWGEGVEGIQAACAQHSLKTVQDVYDFIQDPQNLQRLGRMLGKASKANYLTGLVRKVVEGGAEFNEPTGEQKKQWANRNKPAQPTSFPRVESREPEEDEELPEVETDEDEFEEEPPEETDNPVDDEDPEDEEETEVEPEDETEAEEDFTTLALEMPEECPEDFRFKKAWPKLRANMNAILAAVANGETVIEAEKAAGIGANNTYAWVKRHPRFGELLECARAIGRGGTLATQPEAAKPDVVKEVTQPTNETERRKELAKERAKPEPAPEPRVAFKGPVILDAVAFLERQILDMVNKASQSETPYADMPIEALIQASRLLAKARAEKASA